MTIPFNRRQFLKTAGTALTGTALLGFTPPVAQDFLTFDLHAHPGMFLTKGLPGYPGDAGITKTLTEMHTGQLSGVFISLVADLKTIKVGPDGIKPARSFEPNEAWEDYQRQINILKEMLNGTDVKLATQGNELQKFFKEKKTAAFISVEGGDYLEGKPERVEQMYQDGVRSIQLVHYHPNELGDLQTESPQYNGLSASGKEIVRKMNKLKMVIDVAHATFETARDVAALSDSPVILSHSILQMDGNRPLSKRAISTEHAQVVAKTGGVIGAWPSGFNTSFEDFIDNTLRLVDAVGIDHVGLGTDMDGNFKPVFSSYLQISQWISALKTKGLSDLEVGKIVGGNAKRVVETVVR